MNKRALQAHMLLFGDNGKTLAEALGISRATLSAKMNGGAEFTQREINTIRIRYNLTNDESVSIFFADDVS